MCICVSFVIDKELVNTTLVRQGDGYSDGDVDVYAEGDDYGDGGGDGEGHNKEYVLYRSNIRRQRDKHCFVWRKGSIWAE